MVKLFLAFLLFFPCLSYGVYLDEVSIGNQPISVLTSPALPLTASATITASGQGATINTQNLNTVMISVSGTFVGTLAVEGQIPDLTWVTVPYYIVTGTPPYAVATIINSPGSAYAQSSGYVNFRVRSTAWTSGTAVVTINATVAQQSMNLSAGASTAALQQTLINNQTNGTQQCKITDAGGAGTTFIDLDTTAGYMGAVAVTLRSSTAGQPAIELGTTSNPLIVSPVDGVKDSYSTAVVGLAVAATPTDVFTITGSATKTIRVTRISVTATQSTGAHRDVSVIKRSTANTGGTSTSPVGGPHDSTSPAASAVIRAYTANPTALGTQVAIMRARKVFIATTTTNSDEFIVDFGDRPAEAIVLRGVTQVLSVHLNSVTSAGNSFNINIEWTEE